MAWPRLGEHSVLVGVQDRIAEQMVDFLVFRTRQLFVEAVLEPMSVERIKDRIGKQMANCPGASNHGRELGRGANHTT